MYSFYGLTIKQWLYVATVCVILFLVAIMTANHYQKMELKVVENETNIKWLRRQNDSLRAAVLSVENNIAINSVSIDLLMQKSDILESQGKQIIDSVKKLKLRYNESRNRIDTIDVDGIRRYFSEIPEIIKN